MTSRITGLRIYTSKPVMGATSVFLKFPTGSCSVAEYYTRYTELCFRLLFSDKFTTQTSGGFVVYYVSPGKGKVTAFKPVSTPQRLQMAIISLTMTSRVSECSSATQPNALRSVAERNRNRASVAILAQTLEVIMLHPALTPLWTLKNSLKRLALGAFGRTSYTLRKSFLEKM
jgi:hypothetical protein